ncbi:MAG: L-idonate 5-dehydrogenase [Propionibacteriaceae bacterium]|jgi:L-idonate 5-dehydrogenase|nr:L-idonate 5-dehydrogenase [Propionibacteriaceae bacterium]
MKAAVVHGAGDLRVEERPDPTPGPGQVLMKLEWGGICGSDIAYVKYGQSGTAVLKNPMILGHEFAGTVVGVGEGVDVPIGTRAAVYPPMPVGDYVMPERLKGRDNLYPTVKYYGSAATVPHTDGGFASLKVVQADQLRVLPENVDTKHGALAEPFAVAIHAVHRAGDIKGKDILVNGAGPIGSLVIGALKHLGAGKISAADINDSSLKVAKAMGADVTVNVTREALPEKELVFEASGAAGALGGVLHAVERGGTLIQVGNLSISPVTAVLGDLVTREIDWLGSFRFINEMDDAIRFMSEGLDLTPVMSHTFPLDQAVEAFETAMDPNSGSCKIMLEL